MPDKIVLKSTLKAVRQAQDDKYVNEGEYSPETSVGSADEAKELHTERIIEDLDISCPPITYGIAGGDAEINTGYQELTKLYGNTYFDRSSSNRERCDSSNIHKIISRGKNQFTGFDEFIDVLSSEEYKIITNLPGGLFLTEYDEDYDLNGGCEDEEIGTIYRNIIHPHDYEEEGIDEFGGSNGATYIKFQETTRYIKLQPADPREVNEKTYVMMYNTFGVSYNEKYEEPRVDEITFPDIILRSVNDIRDVIYAEGGGVRNIGTFEVTEDNIICLSNGKLGITLPQDMNKAYGFVPEGCNIHCPNNSFVDYTVYSPRMPYLDARIYYNENNEYLSTNLDWYNNPNQTDIDRLMNFFRGITFAYVMNDPEEIDLEENPGWDPKLFVDNYGTLKFLDEEDFEVSVPQHYQIIYKVSLTEFLDSAYGRSDGSANHLATDYDITDGALVPPFSEETESITPYSDESGPKQDTSFSYQTTAGGSDCGSSATLIKLKGQTVKYNKFKQYGPDQHNPNLTDFDIYRINLNDQNSARIQKPNYATKTDHEYLCYFRQIHYYYSALTPGEYTYTDTESGEQKTKNCGIYVKNKLVNSNASSAINNSTYPFVGFIVRANENLEFTLAANEDLLQADMSTIMFKITDMYWFDLTDMYGMGNEPQSLEEFQKSFPKILYDINGFIHTKPCWLINTGYNQNTEEYEDGLLGDQGDVQHDDTMKVSGFIRVLPNIQYKILANTTISYICLYESNNPEASDSFGYYQVDSHEHVFYVPDKCRYIRFDFDSVENPEISLFILWDGSKQEYERHDEWIYEFPEVTLRSIDNVRDELLPDGTLIQRIGVNDNEHGIISPSGAIELEEGSDKFYFQIDFQDLGWTQPHKIKFEHISDSNVIIDEENGYVYAYIGDSIEADLAHNNSEYELYLKSCIYELETPERTEVDSFDSHLDIDDFGTMEFINRDADELEINISQPCEIVYIADYVAFLDSIGNNSNFDADNIVYKDSPEVASLFDNKNFISMEGIVQPGTGIVTVLWHAKSNMPNSALCDRKQRDGTKIRLSPSATYGTKKCNTKLDSFTFSGPVPIEYLIKMSDTDHLDEEDIELHDKSILLDPSNSPFSYAATHELKKILKEYNKNIYYNEIINGDFSYDQGPNAYNDNWKPRGNASLNGSFTRYSHHGLENLFDLTDSNERNKVIKHYQIRYKKRLAKFVKNYKDDGENTRWYGVMANIGVEVILITCVDWDEESAYNIIGYRYITLK